MYCVTLGSSDPQGGAPTAAPDFISWSKSENPGTDGTDPSTRRSNVLFKLGHARRDSSTGNTSVEVTLDSNLLPTPGPLNYPPQIKVTTERIDEHSETPTNESEDDLKKASSIQQTGPNEVQEELRFSDT